MNRLIALICIVTLSGCATQWVNTKKAPDEVYADKLECDELANRLSWQRYPQRQTPVVVVQNTDGSSSQQPSQEDANYYSREGYRSSSFNDCMNSKGWFEQRIN